MKTYTVSFGRRTGCPAYIAEDMARYDAGKIVEKTVDESCGPDCYRTVTIQGRFDPTMDRWRSFVLGAMIT